MRDEMPIRTRDSRIGPSDSNESRSIAPLTNHPANPPMTNPKTVIHLEVRPALFLTGLIGVFGDSYGFGSMRPIVTGGEGSRLANHSRWPLASRVGRVQAAFIESRKGESVRVK